jgi:hypothetical protein
LIRRLARLVARLCAWLPVIWKDEDYDYHYLLRIMRFKIGRMRKHINAHAHHVNFEKDCHRMRIAECLINRLLSSNYEESEYNRMEREWGKLVINDQGRLRHEKETDENKNAIDQQFMEMCKNAERQEEADWAYLFAHLKRYMRRWWD